MGSMQNLRAYLASIVKGPIIHTTELESLLAAAWNGFNGSDAEGMNGEKLYGRMEAVHWDAPVLMFRIERHGGTVLGSTRAERHQWVLNLDTQIASCHPAGYVQLYPRERSLNVRPLAKEIAQQILDHKEDTRLTWNNDGSVRVHIGKIFPKDSAVQQTLAGRRKRFRQTVEGLLEEKGWRRMRPNVHAPPLSL